MEISVIGAGNIGGTLGKKWAQVGHQVRFGVRSPSDPKFDHLRPLGKVTTIADALAGAEVVLLAQPGTAVVEFAAQFGADLDGKIVIDATNSFRGPVMNNLGILKEKAPGALYVRAFSNLGWENFAVPLIHGETVDLFFCGQAQARLAAEQLISEIGLNPVYIGSEDAVDLVDGLTRLWFTLVNQGRGRRVALKLLVEETP